MTNDRQDNITEGSPFPPRSEIHGKTDKNRKRKKQIHEHHNQSNLDEERIINGTDNQHKESDNSSEKSDDSTTYVYRRPVRKRPSYLLVKVLLFLFLLIVIGMVTFPIWQDWLTMM